MTLLAPPSAWRAPQGFNAEELKNQVAFLSGRTADYQINQASGWRYPASYPERNPRRTVPHQSNCSRTPSYNNQPSYSRASFYSNQSTVLRRPTSYIYQNTSVPGRPLIYDNRWPQNHYTASALPHNQRRCDKGIDQISSTLHNLSLRRDYEREILNVLQQLVPGQSLPAHIIAKNLKIKKKEANRSIYKLYRQGKLLVEGEKPPLWSIADPSLERSVLTHGHLKEQDTKTSREKNTSRDRNSVGCYTDLAGETFSRVRVQSNIKDSNSFAASNKESSTDESSSVTSEEFASVNMGVSKEQICEYLFSVEQSTAMTIAKNIGLQKAKDVNITLYQLEKQGDICREPTTPPKWSLSDKKRDRMQLKKKAHEVLVAETGKEEDVDPSSDSLAEDSEESPLVKDGMNGKERGLVKMESEMNEKHMHIDGSSDEPPTKRLKDGRSDNLNGRFVTDDIPEKMSEEPDLLTVMNKPLELAEDHVPSLTPLEKLLQCIEKNPVSGLIEYSQFMSQTCEFILLQQTGPSHDPRFKIQAVVNGRQFPPVVATNKKSAKKDAASGALKILLRELRGEEEEVVAPENQMEETEKTETEVPTTEPSKSSPTGKNPISVLLESAQKMGFACEFLLESQSGPAHAPSFTYIVKFGDKKFPPVTGNSKRVAKQLAAEAVVKELAESGTLIIPVEVGPRQPEAENDSITELVSEVPALTPEELNAAKSAHVGDLLKYLNANPVSGLLEYARANGFAAEFKLISQSGPPHEPKFIFQAKVGGRWFPAVGAPSKKQAKQEAADAALRVLIGDAEKAERTGEFTPEQLPVTGSTFHDQIAMLSHQRFNSLTSRVQHSLLGRKILAAIIMRSSDDDMGTVISIGTGNRCVKGEELSLKGETVNDCHAEVIARRGLIRFLYSELMKYEVDCPDSIFELAESGKLKILEPITFHLYISTAPCGDGALFDKSCSDPPAIEGDTNHHPLFENPKQGKLRTKVENGEGTIPVESSDIVPTWDGIQHGERLRTMSCSDKILRWNVLGLQGAILTHFMEPVYLNTITLGYLYSQGHLTRAVCCRMSKNGDAFQQGLPPPYTLNHPVVGRVSVYDSTRQTGKTKESSVNWCLADGATVEILDGTKGKVDGPKLEVSRVSKHNIFLLYQELCKKINREDLLAYTSYSEVKGAALDYVSGKEHFVQALAEMGYGGWICKPQEEKSFTVANE